MRVFFSISGSCEQLAEVSAASWFPQALSQLLKAVFRSHPWAYTGNSPGELWQDSGWSLREADGCNTLLCKVLGSQSTRDGSQRISRWSLISHPHSAQQHGLLRAEPECTPGSGLFLWCLPSTQHTQRACPFSPILSWSQTLPGMNPSSQTAVFQLLVCFKLLFLSIC